jgi:hypothetical protein
VGATLWDNVVAEYASKQSMCRIRMCRVVDGDDPDSEAVANQYCADTLQVSNAASVDNK